MGKSLFTQYRLKAWFKLKKDVIIAVFACPYTPLCITEAEEKRKLSLQNEKGQKSEKNPKII